MLSVSPPRGMARREAQSFWCPHPLPNAAGASRRANRGVSGVGPRFNPGLSVRDLTASSWRGLLVVPGGAPMPPECLVAKRPAGAAPRPAITTPRENAPSSGRGGDMIRQVLGAGIKFWGEEKSAPELPFQTATKDGRSLS